jgi:CheY-like chemotaxis protein/anti-sigma regulatory factor (Ser/Thr protein kinase)
MIVDLEPSCGEVFGDTARLQQVAVNLLSNAVKFTPEGGTVRVSLHGAGDFVELTVSDTGRGIAPEFLPWVFEPFRQGDASTTRVHGGLGLGLSIVKTLVDAHNGRITARSDGPGRGATFTVLLPATGATERRQAACQKRPASGAPPIRPEASLEGLSVLLVDDDDQSREVVAAHLQSSHANVLTASSAAQAMEVLEQSNVDVLLADIGMPDEDGYQLIRRVRSLPSVRTASIPAAALTAFAREEDRREALAAGFQLHVAKPVDARSLISAVASLGRMHAV